MKYILYIITFCIGVYATYQANKFENKENLKIVKEPVIPTGKPKTGEGEITFPDLDPPTMKERQDWMMLADSVNYYHLNGVYPAKYDRDTVPIRNGTKAELVILLRKYTFKYTNSAFVVRPFDTLYKLNSYSLWTFKHSTVRFR